MPEPTMPELDRVWRTRSDEALAAAAEALFDYTEAGERCIRDELKRRGLAEPPPPIGACAHCGRAIAANHPGAACRECDTPFPADILDSLAALAPPSQERLLFEGHEERPVFVGSGEYEARQVLSLLEAAGIPAAIRGEAFGRLSGVMIDGLGATTVVVPECDEPRALALLAAADDGTLRLDEPSDPERR